MIDHLDHLVLTTHDAAACIDFYTRVLGMRLERFVGGTPPVERQALVLPEIAVQQEGSQASVFRVGAGDAVALVPVTLGSRHDGKVEIASGLKPGDRIVVEGIVKLHDGSKVVEAGANARAAAAE